MRFSRSAASASKQYKQCSTVAMVDARNWGDQAPLSLYSIRQWKGSNDLTVKEEMSEDVEKESGEGEEGSWLSLIAVEGPRTAVPYPLCPDKLCSTFTQD